MRVSERAVVLTNHIGEGSIIDEFCVIRENVIIGKNVHIFPHVVIEDGITIGDGTTIYPGTYIGKTPNGAGAISREPNFVKIIRLGKNCAVGPNAVIYYDTEIGDHTLIGDGASIRENCKVGSFCIISRHVTLNYEAVIGNHTKIMDGTHITGRATVGNNVFIGMLVSTANDNDLQARKYNPEKDIGPTIEDDVSIGEGVSILPRVRIGKGSLLGAGSVVTKDVDPYSVVVGVPARAIKRI